MIGSPGMTILKIPYLIVYKTGVGVPFKHSKKKLSNKMGSYFFY